MKNPIIVITGTTGTGKSEVGLEVARLIGGEILSLDSMAVYRGMDIGTAKPSVADRRAIPHHMIDIVDPNGEMNLHHFLGRAEEVLEERGTAGVPMVCVGGTMMYLVGLLWGIDEGPPRNDEFRRELQKERDEVGTGVLHQRLAELDPGSAAGIAPQDFQRIERSLEILEYGGPKPSELRTGWFSGTARPAQVHALTWPREILRSRIDARVDGMFEAGWVDEVRNIVARDGFSPAASKALGYREILSFLAGDTRESELREVVRNHTWQFARRQMTWMKKLEVARQVERTSGDSVAELAGEIVRVWGRGPSPAP